MAGSPRPFALRSTSRPNPGPFSAFVLGVTFHVDVDDHGVGNVLFTVGGQVLARLSLNSWYIDAPFFTAGISAPGYEEQTNYDAALTLGVPHAFVVTLTPESLTARIDDGDTVTIELEAPLSLDTLEVEVSNEAIPVTVDVVHIE